jgi:hypothetical protein
MEVTYSNLRTTYIASTPVPSTPGRKTAVRTMEILR